MILFAVIITILFFGGLRTPIANVFSKDIVTVLKPFLAFGIVFHHLHGEAAYLHEFERWGPLVVGIFFFISGYGLTYSLNRRPDYLKGFFTDKILVKLLLPSSLAFILSLCLVQQWNEFSIIERLKCPQGPWIFANDWFIYALIYCYIAFLFAGKIKKASLRLSILIIAPLLLVVFTANMGYARNWWATPMAFSAGALYCHFEPKIRQFIDGKKRYIVTTTCALLVFGLLMGLSAMFGSKISTVIVYSLLPLLLVTIMIRLDVTSLAKNKLIVFFNGISFELYLIHGIVIDHMRFDLDLSSTSLIIASVVTSVIAAYIFKQISTMCQKGVSCLLPRAYTI